MKITLCGSTRFHKRFNELNAQLSKLGHLVYSCAVFEKGGDTLTEDEKMVLDLVHLQKIIESDAVVVICVQDDGKMYIGESTRRELHWACMNDVSIMVEKVINHDGTWTDVTETSLGTVSPVQGVEALRRKVEVRPPKRRTMEELMREAGVEFGKPDAEEAKPN